jgi:hypothetical protein
MYSTIINNKTVIGTYQELADLIYRSGMLGYKITKL